MRNVIDKAAHGAGWRSRRVKRASVLGAIVSTRQSRLHLLLKRHDEREEYWCLFHLL
jgi:hypothetical protein